MNNNKLHTNDGLTHLGFLLKQLDHGPLVVDFHQHTQCPLTPLSELIVLYEPNQDMEMMLNKQLSTSSTKLLLLPKFSHEINNI
jgi:hypothetical protein